VDGHQTGTGDQQAGNFPSTRGRRPKPISIKGNAKDTKVYQIQMVNGQQQKTLLNDQKAGSNGGREGRVKEHVIERRPRIPAVRAADWHAGQAVHRAQPRSPDAGETGGKHLDTTRRGALNLVIKNYLKQGDSMSMTINEQTHSPVGVQVNSYLSDPKDAVTISAQFVQLPDGTNHVATTTIDGVTKQLGINEQNSNYQKLQ